MHSTKICAHKGASKDYRENTISAIEHAIKCGADAVEFDIQQTSDEYFIIYHDEFIPDISKTPVSKTKHEIIRNILREQNIELAGLQEVLECCKGRIFCDIELKDSADAVSVAKIVYDILDSDQFQIKSFEDYQLGQLCECFPHISLALCLGHIKPRYPLYTRLTEFFPKKRALKNKVKQLHTPWKLLRLGFLKRVINNGFKIWVWTIDDTDKIINLLKNPLVDGIITNEPAKAKFLQRQLLEQKLNS